MGKLSLLWSYEIAQLKSLLICAFHMPGDSTNEVKVWIFQTLPVKIASSYTVDKQETFIHD